MSYSDIKVNLEQAKITEDLTKINIPTFLYLIDNLAELIMKNIEEAPDPTPSEPKRNYFWTRGYTQPQIHPGTILEETNESKKLDNTSFRPIVSGNESTVKSFIQNAKDIINQKNYFLIEHEVSDEGSTDGEDSSLDSPRNRITYDNFLKELDAQGIYNRFSDEEIGQIKQALLGYSSASVSPLTIEPIIDKGDLDELKKIPLEKSKLDGIIKKYFSSVSSDGELSSDEGSTDGDTASLSSGLSLDEISFTLSEKAFPYDEKRKSALKSQIDQALKTLNFNP